MSLTFERRHHLRPERVIEGFANHCRMDVALLRNNGDKSRALSTTRRQLMWLLRDLTPASLESIGALLGGRDGSTVWEGIQNVADRMVTDDEFRSQMRAAREACILWATDPLAPRPNIGDGRSIFARVIAAQGVLSDAALSDADARHAARSILSGLMPQPVEAQHG